MLYVKLNIQNKKNFRNYRTSHFFFIYNYTFLLKTKKSRRNSTNLGIFFISFLIVIGLKNKDIK